MLGGMLQKRRWACAAVLATLLPPALFVMISRVMADSPVAAPEFYFTRLVYRQNPIPHGYFNTFTMAKPAPYHCPEFGGRNFFPPQGWGWATDTPGAD